MPDACPTKPEILIQSTSFQELEALKQHIESRTIIFGQGFDVGEIEGGPDPVLRYRGRGNPFMKDNCLWEYPYRRIICDYPGVWISIAYAFGDRIKTIHFGSKPEKYGGKIVKIRPSDLNFLLKCSRCFFLRYNYNFNQPFLSISGGLMGDLANKEETALYEQSTKDWCPEIDPSGTFRWQGRTVVSRPLPISGNQTYYLGGMFDLVAELQDKTYAIIDCKTSAKDENQLAKTYFNQLMAYRYCLENPADTEFLQRLDELDGRIHRQPNFELGASQLTVNHLGLLRFNLCAGTITANPQETSFSADVTYIPVKSGAEKQQKFLRRLQKVADLLEQKDIPPASKYCTACNSLKAAGQLMNNTIPNGVI